MVEEFTLSVDPAMREIARLERRHLAFLAETQRASKRLGTDVASSMRAAGDAQMREIRRASRATTDEQERAHKRLVQSVQRASREARREIAEIRRAASAGLIPPAESQRQIAAIEQRIARFGRRVAQTGTAANAEVRKATVRALRDVEQAAEGGARAQAAAARRVTQAVRRARIDSEREMRRIKREAAAGLIDGAEARRQIAATEARFSRFARRVQQTSGATGRAVTREIGGSLRKVGLEARRAEGYIPRLDRRMGRFLDGVKRRTALAVRGFVAMGAVMLGAFAGGEALRRAVALEDAMVGVAKTTGMGREELRGMRDDLVALSRRLGIAATELAGYAEMAGQLGISGRANIAAFTEAAAKLAEVSDLDPSAAAENVAKLARAFNIAFDEAAALGSVVNELSNTTAATAGDITDAGRRASTAARDFGLTADQTLALNATLIDLGLEARTAGTSIRNVLTLITTKADEAATMAGVTEAEFRKMLGEKPLEALKLYLTELSKIDPQLRAIHVDDVFGKENLAAVTALSTNLGRLDEVLGIASSSFREGTSLTREFDAKMDSFSGQLSVARERAASLAVAIGDRVLPVATDLLRSFNRATASSAELADEFQRLRGQAEEQQHLVDLADKYDELAAKENLTTQEAIQMRSILDELQAASPGFVSAYDAQGRALGVYSGALRDAAEAAMQLYRAQQLAALGDVLRDLSQAQTRRTTSEESQQQLQERWDSGERYVDAPGFRWIGKPGNLVGQARVPLSELINQAGLNVAEARVQETTAISALRGIYGQLLQSNYTEQAAMEIIRGQAGAMGIRLTATVVRAITSGQKPPPVVTPPTSPGTNPVVVPTSGDSDTSSTTTTDPRAGLEDQLDRLLADAKQRAAELGEAQLAIRAIEVEAMAEGHDRVLAQLQLELDERVFRRRENERREIEAIDEALDERKAHLTAAEKRQLEARKTQIAADADAEVEAMQEAHQRVLDATLVELARQAEAEQRALQDAGSGRLTGQGLGERVADREVYGSRRRDRATGRMSSDAPDAIEGLLGVGFFESLDQIARAQAALDEAFEFEGSEAGRERIQELRAALEKLRGEMESVPASIGQATLTALGTVAGAVEDLYRQAGERNLALFRAYQAVSAAQAAVSTYQAAAEMLKPSVGGPPPANYVNAGLVVAAGLVRIGQILSQQPGGSTDGGRQRSRGSATASVSAARAQGGIVLGGEQTIRVNENGPEYVISAEPTRRYRTVLDAINRGEDPAAASLAHLRAAQQPIRQLARDRSTLTGASPTPALGELARTLADGTSASPASSSSDMAGAVAAAVAGALSSLRLRAVTRGSDLLTMLDNAERERNHYL